MYIYVSFSGSCKMKLISSIDKCSLTVICGDWWFLVNRILDFVWVVGAGKGYTGNSVQHTGFITAATIYIILNYAWFVSSAKW